MKWCSTRWCFMKMFIGPKVLDWLTFASAASVLVTPSSPSTDDVITVSVPASCTSLTIQGNFAGKSVAVPTAGSCSVVELKSISNIRNLTVLGGSVGSVVLTNAYQGSSTFDSLLLLQDIVVSGGAGVDFSAGLQSMHSVTLRTMRAVKFNFGPMTGRSAATSTVLVENVKAQNAATSGGKAYGIRMKSLATWKEVTIASPGIVATHSSSSAGAAGIWFEDQVPSSVKKLVVIGRNKSPSSTISTSAAASTPPIAGSIFVRNSQSSACVEMTPYRTPEVLLKGFSCLAQLASVNTGILLRGSLQVPMLSLSKLYVKAEVSSNSRIPAPVVFPDAVSSLSDFSIDDCELRATTNGADDSAFGLYFRSTVASVTVLVTRTKFDIDGGDDTAGLRFVGTISNSEIALVETTVEVRCRNDDVYGMQFAAVSNTKIRTQADTVFTLSAYDDFRIAYFYNAVSNMDLRMANTTFTMTQTATPSDMVLSAFLVFMQDMSGTLIATRHVSGTVTRYGGSDLSADFFYGSSVTHSNVVFQLADTSMSGRTSSFIDGIDDGSGTVVRLGCSGYSSSTVKFGGSTPGRPGGWSSSRWVSPYGGACVAMPWYPIPTDPGPTLTPTPPLSISHSVSVNPTATVAPTETPRLTHTHTEPRTTTATATKTQAATVSASHVGTATDAPTLTQAMTMTNRSTLTASVPSTMTPDLSATKTAVATRSLTTSGSIAPTATQPQTRTPNVTLSLTHALSATRTATASPLLSATVTSAISSTATVSTSPSVSQSKATKEVSNSGSSSVTLTVTGTKPTQEITATRSTPWTNTMTISKATQSVSSMATVSRRTESYSLTSTKSIGSRTSSVSFAATVTPSGTLTLPLTMSSSQSTTASFTLSVGSQTRSTARTVTASLLPTTTATLTESVTQAMTLSKEIPPTASVSATVSFSKSLTVVPTPTTTLQPTLSHDPTWTVPLTGAPAVQQPVLVPDAVRTASQGVAVVTSVLNPVSAMAIQRAAALGRPCNLLDSGEPLSFLEHPLGFVWESGVEPPPPPPVQANTGGSESGQTAAGHSSGPDVDPLRYHAAAVAGNIAVAAVLSTVLFVTATAIAYGLGAATPLTAFDRVRDQEKTFKDRLRAAAVAGYAVDFAVAPLVLLIQPTTRSSLLLMLHPEALWWHRVVAVAAFPIAAVLPLAVTWYAVFVWGPHRVVFSVLGDGAISFDGDHDAAHPQPSATPTDHPDGTKSTAESAKGATKKKPRSFPKRILQAVAWFLVGTDADWFGRPPSLNSASPAVTDGKTASDAFSSFGELPALVVDTAALGKTEGNNDIGEDEDDEEMVEVSSMSSQGSDRPQQQVDRNRAPITAAEVAADGRVNHSEQPWSGMVTDANRSLRPPKRRQANFSFDVGLATGADEEMIVHEPERESDLPSPPSAAANSHSKNDDDESPAHDEPAVAGETAVVDSPEPVDGSTLGSTKRTHFDHRPPALMKPSFSSDTVDGSKALPLAHTVPIPDGAATPHNASVGHGASSSTASFTCLHLSLSDNNSWRGSRNPKPASESTSANRGIPPRAPGAGSGSRRGSGGTGTLGTPSMYGSPIATHGSPTFLSVPPPQPHGGGSNAPSGPRSNQGSFDVNDVVSRGSPAVAAGAHVKNWSFSLASSFAPTAHGTFPSNPSNIQSQPASAPFLSPAPATNGSFSWQNPMGSIGHGRSNDHGSTQRSDITGSIADSTGRQGGNAPRRGARGPTAGLPRPVSNGSLSLPFLGRSIANFSFADFSFAGPGGLGGLTNATFAAAPVAERHQRSHDVRWESVRVAAVIVCVGDFRPKMPGHRWAPIREWTAHWFFFIEVLASVAIGMGDALSQLAWCYPGSLTAVAACGLYLFLVILLLPLRSPLLFVITAIFAVLQAAVAISGLRALVTGTETADDNVLSTIATYLEVVATLGGIVGVLVGSCRFLIRFRRRQQEARAEQRRNAPNVVFELPVDELDLGGDSETEKEDPVEESPEDPLADFDLPELPGVPCQESNEPSETDDSEAEEIPEQEVAVAEEAVIEEQPMVEEVEEVFEEDEDDESDPTRYVDAFQVRLTARERAARAAEEARRRAAMQTEEARLEEERRARLWGAQEKDALDAILFSDLDAKADAAKAQRMDVVKGLFGEREEPSLLQAYGGSSVDGPAQRRRKTAKPSDSANAAALAPARSRGASHLLGLSATKTTAKKTASEGQGHDASAPQACSLLPELSAPVALSESPLQPVVNVPKTRKASEPRVTAAALVTAADAEDTFDMDDVLLSPMDGPVRAASSLGARSPLHVGTAASPRAPPRISLIGEEEDVVGDVDDASQFNVELPLPLAMNGYADDGYEPIVSALSIEEELLMDLPGLPGRDNEAQKKTDHNAPFVIQGPDDEHLEEDDDGGPIVSALTMDDCVIDLADVVGGVPADEEVEPPPVDDGETGAVVFDLSMTDGEQNIYESNNQHSDNSTDHLHDDLTADLDKLLGP